jgi:L-amino acid N-acyltransferase YncA/2-polyprenyl-3-methyl-5-hydroxy-6-metoxy-1,4-benzoquinol methylase
VVDEQALRERDAVVERYSGLARNAAAGRAPASGCGSAAYPELGDVPEGALQASLACGNPVAVADLQPGERVLDLGSGAGLDVLMSAGRVGPDGWVVGIDASPDMLALARRHAAGAGVSNVEFRQGYLEELPLPDAAFDVVISNCVLTLSVDKARALAEAARALRPGGRFGITDILAEPGLDPQRRAAAEAAIGCGVRALTAEEYRVLLLGAGFTTASITPTHPVGDGLFSAIVQAGKPAAPDGVVVRPMRDADADAVLAIYQAGLDAGHASFETVVPPWARFWAARLPEHRLVAVADGRVVGWVAASAVSSRCVYAGVVEHSVYVDPAASRRGIGGALLRALVDSTETAGIWTIQAGIFPENSASLALHRRAGFTVVGTRRRIGRHRFGGTDRWRDVVYLERRSPVVGVD